MHHMQSKGRGQADDGPDLRHQEEHSSCQVRGDEERRTVQGLDSTAKAGHTQRLDGEDGSGREKGAVSNGGNENDEETGYGPSAEQRKFGVYFRNHGRDHIQRTSGMSGIRVVQAVGQEGLWTDAHQGHDKCRGAMVVADEQRNSGGVHFGIGTLRTDGRKQRASRNHGPG
eukprot:6989042-Heterocapsa_arctica.AAC.1